MTATIYSIAKKCHCSTATVSKALNGSGRISEIKKREILAVADELGYIPSSSARGLATSKRSANLIGVILHDLDEKSITHELFSGILNSFRIEAENRGYDICFLRRLQEGKSYSYINLLKSRGCDGVLVLCADHEDSKIIELVSSDFPVVCFDAPESRYEVTSNNTESMAAIVDALVKQGHRSIAYISPHDFGISLERLNGFKAGIKRNGIKYDPRMIVNAPFYCENSAKIGTEKAFASGIDPTVIIYPDDYTAIAAYRYLLSHGKKAGHSVGVVGFDGIELASVIHPSLTTVKQDHKQIGIEAAKLLFKVMEEPNLPSEHIVVPAKILVGASSQSDAVKGK